MKNIKVLTVLSILSLLLIESCSSVAKIPVTRPAEINLTGIKRVAIGNIEGDTGLVLSDLLSQKLFESGHYEVLDRQNINALLREHNLNLKGAINKQTSIKLGGLLGASALIFGKSNGQYRQINKVGDPYNCSKNGRVCRTYTKTGEGRVNATLRVVDLQTGKIIAIKSYAGEDSDSVLVVNGWPSNPDETGIIYKILNTIANKFMKMVAPYTEYVSVKFENSNTPGVEAGIIAAQAGQWDSASVQFKNAVNTNPNDAAAWFNLGLAYMYTNQFDDSIQALNKSNGLNPSSKSVQEISNCKRLKADRKKLSGQMGNHSN